MTPEQWSGPVMMTAALVGCLHTLLGPDHYVPFIALGRARGWSAARVLAVTTGCGVAHVLGSAVLGLVGIAAGIALTSLQRLESARGELAGWLLIGFGLAYFLWGLRQAWRRRPHTHLHVHADGTVHTHRHVHVGDHLHAHIPEHAAPDDASPRARAAPWVLFIIFAFGPCEPLIPLVMYAAADGGTSAAINVTIVFGLTTLATMCALVSAGYLGWERLMGERFAGLHRFGHATAGFVVLICGVAVKAGL